MFPGNLHAGDLPKRKSGFWEITERAVKSHVAARTVYVCIDEATESLLNNVNAITRKTLCSQSNTKVNGSVLSIETICEFRNSRVDTRSTITITDPVSYHIEAQALYSPPLFGQRQATRVQDGKWNAACPPDMRPGDIIADDLAKRNLADTAEFGATVRSGPAESSKKH